MTEIVRNLTQIEQINFLLTNRIPRRLLTRLMGWYSRIKSPLLTRISIGLWKLFSPDLNLFEAKKQRFNSLHECFIRELVRGVRPIDPASDVIISPCDAIVGAYGEIKNQRVFQAKGFPYSLPELIPDTELCRKLEDGVFVTLRLRSSMYHRFHAPCSCAIKSITYISGDTWNVNPVALKRIEKLYVKNERAVMPLELDTKGHIVLVPVAAILVASMKFHCLDESLNLKYSGPNHIECSASYRKGDELGYFEHGSTIIVFASSEYTIGSRVVSGQQLRMGEALLHRKH